MKTRAQQIQRALMLVGFMFLAFAGLGYRLVDLQVLRHDELSALAEENTQHDFWQTPRRGDILDVNGNVLATSVPVKRICADPSLIGGEKIIVARALAPLLQTSETELVEKLTPRISRNDKGELITNGLHYVRLTKKNVSEETWERVDATMMNLTFGVNEKKLSRANRAFFYNLRHSAIFAEPDQMRIYLNGSLASQVVGFSGTTEAKVAGHAISEIVGRDGIEEKFDSVLSGVMGWRDTEVDRQQRELVALRDEDVQARDGLNVVLTLDSAVQGFVEQELAAAMKEHSPKSITAIVMRPRTGEILAMASLPAYNANQSETIMPENRDRNITDVIEPGSTFKIVVVSGALNDNVVKLTDQFYCEHGHFAFAGRILHDHEPFDYLTTESIITKSSNIGAAKIGIKLGEQNLYDYAWQYGFGQQTGIPLPGEARGILHPVKEWSKDSIAQIPMGHGVAVTRLQMTMAMAAIANDGWLMRPMLVKCLKDRDGSVVQSYAPQRVRQVISENTDKLMIEALKTVPTAGGTAAGAAMKDYIVAGKTGTAQKVENGTYAQGKYIASFIGFFPADDPQICISVVMDEPKEGYYGGQVCGPVFREIAERCASYFSIPPNSNLMTNAPPLIVQNLK